MMQSHSINFIDYKSNQSFRNNQTFCEGIQNSRI